MTSVTLVKKPAAILGNVVKYGIVGPSIVRSAIDPLADQVAAIRSKFWAITLRRGRLHGELPPIG